MKPAATTEQDADRDRRFDVLARGMVHASAPSGGESVCAGARTALMHDGRVVCTFNAQTAIGQNDFKPRLTRSNDGGLSWEKPTAMWPHLESQYSIVGSVSVAPNGELMFYGMRIAIDEPGESFWCEQTQGIKTNELIWARSNDAGVKWTTPTVIPMPTAGSAEAPGAMCVTRSGGWHGCYAPYHTFDPNVAVERNQIVLMSSDDEGQTWSDTAMLRFDAPYATGAEAWVIELADGTLLGTSWHMDQQDGSDFPNAYALSRDGGHTWSDTRSTGIMGQSTGLAPLPDGRALFIYNQRRHDDPGVRMAVVNPTEGDFGVDVDAMVWSVDRPRGDGHRTRHRDWLDFNFGEPHVTVLDDGTWLVVLWSDQPGSRGVPFIKLRGDG